MTSASKFGLIVGIVLVVAIAILFFKDEPGASSPTRVPQGSGPAATPPANPSAAAMLPPPTPGVKPERQ